MRALIILTLFAAGHSLGQEFDVSVIAGIGPTGFLPQPALSAGFVRAGGIAVESGNIYFSASLSAGGLYGRPFPAVLKVDPDGLLTLISGAPLPLPAGSIGGPPLREPGNVVLDRSGNLYIADGPRVRTVSPNGSVMTVAGTGVSGYSGDGGPATDAMVANATLLAIDGLGNLYLGDLNRIRKVSPDAVITTVAGTGRYGFSGDLTRGPGVPLGSLAGLAADGAGNLYFSENFENFDDETGSILERYAHVRKIAPDGTITTVAGSGPSGDSGDGGPATLAQLVTAGPLALDGAGNLYVADMPACCGCVGNCLLRIRKVSANGIITTLPLPAGALPGFISALAADESGNLYAGSGPFIIRISNEGAVTKVAGSGAAGCCGPVALGDGGPAAQAAMTPIGVAVDAGHTIYLSEGNRIRKIAPGGIITSVAGKGVGGVQLGDGGPASNAYLCRPAGLTFDRSGALYFADACDHRIRTISPEGVITTMAGSGPINLPTVAGDGGLATDARLNWPKDVAFDASGNLYIADSGNSRIRMVTPAGIITTVAGAGPAGYSGDGGPAAGAYLNLAAGVAIDASGDLYIADTGNFRVRKVSKAGIITTVAGIGVKGSAGDGGRAVLAQLRGPSGLKFDAAGNLYIADETSVRVVSPGGIIRTVAPEAAAWALAVDVDGSVYATDPWNGVVRALKPRR